MEYTLLKEINSKTLTAYLNKRIYDKLFWPNFFPLKYTPFLTYETLIGSMGNRVAADIVSYNSSAPLKTRSIVGKLSGALTPFRIKRAMEETDINTYNVLKAQAKTDQKALLDFIFGDVDFVVDGIQAKLEWLVFQALSQSTVTLAKTYAADVVTENAINFQLPAANQEVCTAANRYWGTATAATMKPITDIETIAIEAATYGVKFKYILMNRTKWQHFRGAAEVQSYIPYAVYNGTAVTRAPSLKMVNDFLSGEDLPQIIIMDTNVILENEAHTRTNVNPWTTKYVTFIPDMKCGDMLYGPIAEETNAPKQVTQSKKGPILVSKYSDVDPVKEYTKGELNAFPSWNTIDHCWILNTTSHTTFTA